MSAWRTGEWCLPRPHVGGAAGRCQMLHDATANASTVLFGTDGDDGTISLADVLLWGVIRGESWDHGDVTAHAQANHISSGMIFNDPRRGHLLRWFKYLDAHPALEATRRAHRLAKNKVENERRRRRSCGGGLDAILPTVEEGEVVVRFGESPSLTLPLSLQHWLTCRTECSSATFLHVGELKELLVNRYFADKHGGHLLLRLEDLRPLTGQGEFVDDIIADLQAIGVRIDGVVRATDHLATILRYGRTLIQMGLAYMDHTPWEHVSHGREEWTHARRRR